MAKNLSFLEVKVKQKYIPVYIYIYHRKSANPLHSKRKRTHTYSLIITGLRKCDLLITHIYNLNVKYGRHLRNISYCSNFIFKGVLDNYKKNGTSVTHTGGLFLY